jgi:carboxyl-terminal processing protease
VKQAKLEVIADQPEHHESELRGALNNDGLKPDQGQNQNQNQDQNQTPPAGGGSSSGSTPTTTTAPGTAPAQTPPPGSEIGNAAQDYQLGRALDLLRGLALIQAQKAN